MCREFLFLNSCHTNIHNVRLNPVFDTKSPFEFVFSCCESTKVILQSKSWSEMVVLKLSGIQMHWNICVWLQVGYKRAPRSYSIKGPEVLIERETIQR